METIDPQLDNSWKEILSDEFSKPYFAQLKIFLKEEKRKYSVYPPGPLIFNAFNMTPFNKVRVVILGQDPYHGHGQAHGLCFSVSKNVKPPPSLINIFKEIEKDLEIPMANHGNLECWASQGVLLLNTTLTVRANTPLSHQNQGWEKLTDVAIQRLSKDREHLVFMLWGRFAQQKENLIDGSRHLVLKAAHPSPFSAYQGFFGCKHFSKANEYLLENGLGVIDWKLENEKYLFG